MIECPGGRGKSGTLVKERGRLPPNNGTLAPALPKAGPRVGLQLTLPVAPGVFLPAAKRPERIADPLHENKPPKHDEPPAPPLPTSNLQPPTSNLLPCSPCLCPIRHPPCRPPRVTSEHRAFACLWYRTRACGLDIDLKFTTRLNNTRRKPAAMYITSDLFTAEPAATSHSSTYQDSKEWTSTPDWPESSLFPANLGKRKRNNTDRDLENCSTSSNRGNEGSSPYAAFEAALNPRQNLLRTRSLPVSPRDNYNDIHIFHTTHLPSGPRSLFAHTHDLPFASTSSHLTLDGPPLPKHRRKILPPKSSRLSALVTTSANLSASPLSSPHDLRPCNVCHKAPTRTRDLEFYTSCQACGSRACQICTRTCEGGCGERVCSACCREVGREGDSWCKGCVERRRVEGEDKMICCDLSFGKGE
jgi:hypothetical protein